MAGTKGRIGQPPVRRSGKGQPIYVTAEEAARIQAAERARKAAEQIHDRPTPTRTKTPAPTPAKPKPAPRPVVAARTQTAATQAPSTTAPPPAGGLPGYRQPTPAEMSRQAAALVAQILGPQIASTTETFRNKGAGVDAAYQAVAKMQEGVAPAITKTYDAASAREAVIAKGLALGAQLAGAETAGASNDTLGQNNSPQQVKAADIGSILSTLGGMSATGLNREGAAFSSAAQLLPTQSRNLGVDAIKSAANEGTAAIGALNARRPELIQGVLAQLQKSDLDNRALAQNEAVLAREGYIKETGLTPEGTMPFETRKWFTDTFGVDPETSLPTLEYQRAATAQKQYAARGKKGGFTASQIRDLKADALVDAKDAFESETTYQDAILTMLAGGYPLVVAQNALNRFWKRPGVVMPWEDVGKGRPKRSFQQRRRKK